MEYDCRGLKVTSTSAEAVAHFDNATRSFLAHRSDAADHLSAALARDPDLALGHCFHGFALLLLGRSELFAPARNAAAQARRAMARRGATLREQRFCQALQFWLDGEMENCAALLENALADQKLDALAFKLAHAIRFLLGDARAMVQAANSLDAAWSPDSPDYGFILGCRAFALEEIGALSAAESCGRQAVEIAAQDVWAAHAVAHVYETRRLPAAGIAWLSRWNANLDGVNNFAGHLYWHEALFQLAAGRNDAALALYDTKIRCVRTDDYRDIANAASLLLRLERAGGSVGARWDELADIAERRTGDHALVFAQLNYLLCLTGAKRRLAISVMLDAMRRSARDGRGSQARILAGVGVPMATLLAGDRCHSSITHHDLRAIGGSNAQRAVFEGILDDAHAPTSALRPGNLAA
jgi:tetratricopeptide (TPR) repeat protein